MVQYYHRQKNTITKTKVKTEVIQQTKRVRAILFKKEEISKTPVLPHHAQWPRVAQTNKLRLNNKCSAAGVAVGIDALKMTIMCLPCSRHYLNRCSILHAVARLFVFLHSFHLVVLHALHHPENNDYDYTYYHHIACLLWTTIQRIRTVPRQCRVSNCVMLDLIEISVQSCEALQLVIVHNFQGDQLCFMQAEMH